MQRDRLGDLAADAVQRVEAGHRLLEDHARRRSPRARCSASGSAPIICCSSSRMLPVGLLPPGGRSCSSDSAVTDLPEPDSPTSASVSPRSRRERHVVDHALRAEGDGQVARPRPGSCGRPRSGVARIECVAHRLADEDQQRQHAAQHEERGEPQPRRLQVVLAPARPVRPATASRAAGRSRGNPGVDSKVTEPDRMNGR